MDSSKITDNKTFWKNIQLFFLEKRKTVNKITLSNENEDILSNDFLKNPTKMFRITEKNIHFR